ncbi:hypothetical protein [Pseudoalteromonas ruthenica]|uniref:hypothetical protein n=1 Tax=Pseudoalteromonas ruthenica TaxID=151081 RepID=UPI00110B6A37|nr:hypothetical protein [Pseudoalteromonas ruthenica]TMO97572.1 hypothetical protein CWC07_13910 [Pseudoalteromonas ruthenica]
MTLKQVNYFGYELKVANDITHIAQDATGIVYAYGFKPQIDFCGGWGFEGSAPGAVHKIGALKLKVNWNESLREVA